MLQLAQSSGDLSPKDVELMDTHLRLSRRLGVRIRDINVMLNWNFAEWDELRLLDELISKVQDKVDWDIDIRRYKCLSIPPAKEYKSIY